MSSTNEEEKRHLVKATSGIEEFLKLEMQAKADSPKLQSVKALVQRTKASTGLSSDKLAKPAKPDPHRIQATLASPPHPQVTPKVFHRETADALTHLKQFEASSTSFKNNHGPYKLERPTAEKRTSLKANIDSSRNKLSLLTFDDNKKSVDKHPLEKTRGTDTKESNVSTTRNGLTRPASGVLGSVGASPGGRNRSAKQQEGRGQPDQLLSKNIHFSPMIDDKSRRVPMTPSSSKHHGGQSREKDANTRYKIMFKLKDFYKNQISYVNTKFIELEHKIKSVKETLKDTLEKELQKTQPTRTKGDTFELFWYTMDTLNIHDIIQKVHDGIAKQTTTISVELFDMDQTLTELLIKRQENPLSKQCIEKLYSRTKTTTSVHGSLPNSTALVLNSSSKDFNPKSILRPAKLMSKSQHNHDLSPQENDPVITKFAEEIDADSVEEDPLTERNGESSVKSGQIGRIEPNWDHNRRNIDHPPGTPGEKYSIVNKMMKPRTASQQSLIPLFH